MAILFISDLHLQADEPKITATFLRFLQERAVNANALYILGDLFEAWIGDDDRSEFNLDIMHALKQATQSGLPIYFMRGNRDFLIGKEFIKKTGMTLLPDPAIIDLYGVKTLLMHGDSLCTLDEKHQKWRRITLNPVWQRLALCLPLALRRHIGGWLRGKSRRHQNNMADYILDVTIEAVRDVMQTHQATQLIHGHTHRPGIHTAVFGKRLVLGAWHDHGSVLCCDETGCELQMLPHSAEYSIRD